MEKNDSQDHADHDLIMTLQYLAETPQAVADLAPEIKDQLRQTLGAVVLENGGDVAPPVENEAEEHATEPVHEPSYNDDWLTSPPVERITIRQALSDLAPARVPAEHPPTPQEFLTRLRTGMIAEGPDGGLGYSQYALVERRKVLNLADEYVHELKARGEQPGASYMQYREVVKGLVYQSSVKGETAVRDQQRAAMGAIGYDPLKHDYDTLVATDAVRSALAPTAYAPNDYNFFNLDRVSARAVVAEYLDQYRDLLGLIQAYNFKHSAGSLLYGSPTTIQNVAATEADYRQRRAIVGEFIKNPQEAFADPEAVPAMLAERRAAAARSAEAEVFRQAQAAGQAALAKLHELGQVAEPGILQLNEGETALLTGDERLSRVTMAGIIDSNLKLIGLDLLRTSTQTEDGPTMAASWKSWKPPHPNREGYVEALAPNFHGQLLNLRFTRLPVDDAVLASLPKGMNDITPEQARRYAITVDRKSTGRSELLPSVGDVTVYYRDRADGSASMHMKYAGRSDGQKAMQSLRLDAIAIATLTETYNIAAAFQGGAPGLGRRR